MIKRREFSIGEFSEKSAEFTHLGLEFLNRVISIQIIPKREIVPSNPQAIAPPSMPVAPAKLEDDHINARPGNKPWRMIPTIAAMSKVVNKNTNVFSLFMDEIYAFEVKF